jgi:hypothetical protein
MEYTGTKSAMAIADVPIAGVTTLALTAIDRVAGFELHWSIANQLSMPAKVTIATAGLVSAFDATSGRERTGVEVQLPAKTNGGYIYLPGAYRAASGMMQGAFQLVSVAVAGADIIISGCPADSSWEARPLGPFNTATQRFIAILKQLFDAGGR